MQSCWQDEQKNKSLGTSLGQHPETMSPADGWTQTGAGQVDAAVVIRTEPSLFPKAGARIITGQPSAASRASQAKLIVAAVRSRKQEVVIWDPYPFGVDEDSLFKEPKPQMWNLHNHLKREREIPQLDLINEYAQVHRRAAALYFEEINEYRRGKQLKVFRGTTYPGCTVLIRPIATPAKGHETSHSLPCKLEGPASEAKEFPQPSILQRISNPDASEGLQKTTGSQVKLASKISDATVQKYRCLEQGSSAIDKVPLVIEDSAFAALSMQPLRSEATLASGEMLDQISQYGTEHRSQRWRKRDAKRRFLAVTTAAASSGRPCDTKIGSSESSRLQLESERQRWSRGARDGLEAKMKLSAAAW